jgi:SMI1 / KNR4 family (SUKH-1)
MNSTWIEWQPLAGLDAAGPLAISALEAALGHALPGDYAAWLRDVNGGRPTTDYWQFDARWRADLSGLNETMELYRLYGLGEQEPSVLARQRDLAGRIPRDAIPIGDAAGPVLLMLLNEDAYGHIKLWLPDTWGDHDQTHPEQLGHIADSFGAFLHGLRYVAG